MRGGHSEQPSTAMALKAGAGEHRDRAHFERPATVITESPDEASHQAIRAALFATVGESSAHRAS
jgi:hypothetical protein